MKQKFFLPKSFGFNEFWRKILSENHIRMFTYLLTFPLSDLSINLWQKLFLVFNPQGMIPIFEVAYIIRVIKVLKNLLYFKTFIFHKCF